MIQADYVDLAAEEKRLESPNFRTHPDLIRKRRGRKVVNGAKFYSRYPEDFHHSFDYDEPDNAPWSIALM